MPRQSWTALLGLALALVAQPATAGELPNAGGVVDCTPMVPPCIAWWAMPSRGPGDCGGYVGGGGNLGHGEARYLHEGTWGWDYQGCLGFPKIWLSWNHGKRYQGGQGAYRTDGHPVKNVLANPPLPGSEH